MFERFTDEGRQAVTLAQEEARLLSHNYLGTEHLLLGLVRDHRSIAARVLARMGVASEAARERVLALLQPGEDDLASYADALDAIGIDLARVRERIESAFGPGALAPRLQLRTTCRRPPLPGALPATPRLKKSFELAWREAELLRQDRIGTEHLLLGLLREGEGIAARVLGGIGVTLTEARARVLELRGTL